MSDFQSTSALNRGAAASPGATPPARVRRPGREAVRRRLLDAALGVFAESGFDNASVDQVAAAAGLTKGAVYSNFASKDDLFLAMMSDQILYRVEKVRTVLSVLPMEIQPRQTLRAIGGLLTEALIEQREWRLVFLDFWRRALRDDEVRAKFVAHRRALRSAIAENIEQVLERAPADSGMTVDEVVTLVLALSNGLAIEQYVAPESVSDGLFGRVLERLALS
jgi:AcrR family transcriptional regulator